MWTLCNQADSQIAETVWLRKNLEGGTGSKAEVRQHTYQALIAYLESQPEENESEETS